MSSDLILYELLVFGPVIIVIFCLCWPICKGKIRACNAIPLPAEESQRIINSMQGDWDVTLTPGGLQGICMCGCSRFERMTVSGSIIARLNPGRGANRPIQLRPAKTDDGTLLLDTYGSKAIVFTPEQGHMQTDLMGWKCEWRKVGWQENLEQGQRTEVAQVASSGQGSMAAEIQRLHQLHEQRILTEEEFSTAKYRILNPGESSAGPSAPYDLPPPYPADLEAGLPLKNY